MNSLVAQNVEDVYDCQNTNCSTNYRIFNHIITGEEINYYAIKD